MNLFTISVSVIVLMSLVGTAWAMVDPMAVKEHPVMKESQKTDEYNKDKVSYTANKEDVKSDTACPKQLVRAFKVADGTPVCIKSTSVSELINKRGWAEFRVENFVQCLAAGNSPMESMPRQCMHDKTTYTEVLEKETIKELKTNETEEIKKFKIGLMYTKEGDLRSQGDQLMAASNLSINEFNAKNKGVFSIELMAIDTATNATKALEAVKEFNKNDIKAVSGPSSSMELAAIIEYAKENDMTIVSCCSTAPSLVKDDSVFRMRSTDGQQVEVIAELMRADGIDAVINVHRDDTWGNDFNKETATNFDGIEIADTISYKPDDHDAKVIANLISDAVEKIESEKDIGVMMIGFDETSEILKEFGEMPNWESTRWYGTDVNSQSDTMVTDDMSEIVNGVKFTSPHTYYIENPTYDRVKDHIKEMVKVEAISYAYPAYDAIQIIGIAAKMADGDTAKIADMIPGVVAQYSGATGEFKLDESGDRMQDTFDIYKIKDQEWILFDRYHESQLRAQKMVADAIEQHKNKVKIKDLNIKEFSKAETYLFVIKDKMIVFHGADDSMIGVDITTLKDDTGTNVGEAILDASTENGAWVQYMWTNPVTNNTESKSSWVVTYDGYIFGVGAYGQQNK